MYCISLKGCFFSKMHIRETVQSTHHDPCICWFSVKSVPVSTGMNQDQACALAYTKKLDFIKMKIFLFLFLWMPVNKELLMKWSPSASHLYWCFWCWNSQFWYALFFAGISSPVSTQNMILHIFSSTHAPSLASFSQSCHSFMEYGYLASTNTDRTKNCTLTTNMGLLFLLNCFLFGEWEDCTYTVEYSESGKK